VKSYHLVHDIVVAIFVRMSTLFFFAAAGVGLASLALACTNTTNHHSSLDDEVRELARRSEEANDALMRGDVDRYRALVPLADDFMLMSPFGGEPSHGVDQQRIDALRSFFKNGALKQELVGAYRSVDLIVLAVIERAHVEVGGLPMQDWALRVTLVYRREGSEWRLAHRHADPLALGISREHAAALGRGAVGR